MFCDICGSDGPALRTAKVEGAQLLLCAHCAGPRGDSQPSPAPASAHRPAHTPSRPAPPRYVKPSRPPPGWKPPENPTLVENYGALVQQARARKGWTREELAKKIFEKASHVAHIENNAATPGDRLIKKLEETLSISLTELESEDLSPSDVARPASSEKATLADFIKPKKRS